MKYNFYLFLLSLLSSNLQAQIIPVGLQLSPRGKVGFIQFEEESYQSKIVDTVHLICDGAHLYLDYQQYLRENMTLLSPYSPKETSYTIIPQKKEDKPDWLIELPKIYDLIDTAQAISYDGKQPKRLPYDDEWNYHGNIDSSQKEAVKRLLKEYIAQYTSSNLDWDVWYELHEKLSEEDTLIEKEMVYDFIINKVVIFEYEQDRPKHIYGYYHDSGSLENDTLNYDAYGNLNYYHHESVGIGGEQWYFTYNNKQQLTYLKVKSYDYHSEYYDECPDCKYYDMLEEYHFKYDADGFLSFRSEVYEGKTFACKLKLPKIAME